LISDLLSEKLDFISVSISDWDTPIGFISEMCPIIKILCPIFQQKTKCVQFHRFHIGSVSECWPFMSNFSTKNKKYPVPSDWYRKRRSLWRQSRKNNHFPTRSSLGCCKIRWTFLLLSR
jgi:hypothetical protein